MEDHINKELLIISSHINVEIDPVFEDLLKKIFIWANEMGLNGYSVTPFYLKKGNSEPLCDPSLSNHKILCSIYKKKNDDIQS